MERFEEIKKRLMLISQEAADTIIRECLPLEDELTENVARKLYGDKWLRKKKAEGLAQYQRVGKRNVFSRAQLDKLRQQEREPAKLLFKRD